MTIPEQVPTLLAELERLGVPVESVCIDPKAISVETDRAYFVKSPEELGAPTEVARSPSDLAPASEMNLAS